MQSSDGRACTEKSHLIKIYKQCDFYKQNRLRSTNNLTKKGRPCALQSDRGRTLTSLHVTELESSVYCLKEKQSLQGTRYNSRCP